jgi:CRISPR-associated exonuclease Cas4
MHAFRDLETVAYCPRKLYYRRREGVPSIPNEVATVRSLAFEYERLREDDAALLAAPIEVDPATYRERLDRASERLDAWDVLASPPARDVLLTGREARGVAHKVIEEPLAPSLAFAGQPPDEGVWEPQTVRLVAAAKALSWERETPVDRAYAEYPAHGVIRPVELTVRRRAAYRRAVRTADRVDGPPPRLDDEAKCRPCEYSEECGTTTRSLKSLLSL